MHLLHITELLCLIGIFLFSCIYSICSRSLSACGSCEHLSTTSPSSSNQQHRVLTFDPSHGGGHHSTSTTTPPLSLGLLRLLEDQGLHPHLPLPPTDPTHCPDMPHNGRGRAGWRNMHYGGRREKEHFQLQPGREAEESGTSQGGRPRRGGLKREWRRERSNQAIQTST